MQRFAGHWKSRRGDRWTREIEGIKPLYRGCKQTCDVNKNRRWISLARLVERHTREICFRLEIHRVYAEHGFVLGELMRASEPLETCDFRSTEIVHRASYVQRAFLHDPFRLVTYGRRSWLVCGLYIFIFIQLSEARSIKYCVSASSRTYNKLLRGRLPIFRPNQRRCDPRTRNFRWKNGRQPREAICSDRCRKTSRPLRRGCCWRCCLYCRYCRRR